MQSLSEESNESMEHQKKQEKEGFAQGESEPYDASVQYDIEHTPAYQFFASSLNNPEKFRQSAKPHTRENRKAIFHHRMPDGKLVFCGYRKLTPYEEAILNAKPCARAEPEHSKIAWPKQESNVLAEWKENPSAPAVVKRIPVSQLKTTTFYGDSATLQDVQKDIRKERT